MKRGWLIAIFVVAVSGVVFGYPGLGKLSMDQQAIVRIFETYVETQNAADADAWIKLWDTDGIKLGYGAPMIFGKAAIYEGVKAKFPLYKKTMTVDIREIVVFGDFAFADGVFTVSMTLKSSGVASYIDGKFMTLLRKQPNGTWLIYRDTTSSNK